MEDVVQTLFNLPIVGLLLQFVAYSIEVLPRIAPSTLALAAPIALGALCGVLNERSGVVNIGIEGIMLIAAFTAFLVAGLVNQSFPAERSDVFGATPALLVGVVAALVVAMLVSTLHAWLSITIRADQIISGTIINIAALGMTGFLNRLVISPNPRLGAGTFRSFDPPAALVDIPFVGWIFKAFLDQGPIAMSVIVLVIIVQIALFRTRWGLRTRAVGEHPKAADTVGINVVRLRYQNVIIGGLFAGLAGAYLTLEATSSFQNGMTAGRGFIALAAVIFGRWSPIGAFGAAILFTAADAFGNAVQLRPPSGNLAPLGDVLTAIPDQFFGALPYIITIIVLAGVVRRSIPPAAVGRPYEKESTA